MRSTFRSAVPWAVVCAALFVIVGCGRSAFTDEMRQQETDMTSEMSDWKSQLAQWESDQKQMQEWVAAHPVPTAGSPVADDLKHHEEKLTDHAQQVMEFQADFATHDQKLKDESAKPEKDRVAAHAALWAEHMKLKTSFAMLRGAHEDLTKEHAEVVSKAENPTKSD